MIRRRTSEAGGGVLSFTFLDVLTCTMGSLVLLLVVLAQKATDVTLEEALANANKPKPAAAEKPPTAASTERPDEPGKADDGAESTLVDLQQHVEDDPAGDAKLKFDEKLTAAEKGLTPEELAKELAEVREARQKIDKMRAETAQRLKDDEAKVGHLEEHERRLEQEIAKLRLALERLEEAEKDQSVDQEAAKAELERLKEVVADTQKQIEELRKETVGKKSYAIVPYKGANGTTRRPIYIECTKDAVTIYPEGIRLTAADFDGPLRSGNPLNAAIRAAREELNARATAAGQTDLPDPYPLLIVRPDGAYAYGAAMSAISSWDSDFGYEFVDADWKLEYPETDPRLEQAMRHAVEQARQRQAMLAKAAPRRYGPRLTLGSGEGGGMGGGDADGDGGGAGFEGVVHPGGDGDRIGDHSGENWMAASSGGQGTGVDSAGATGTGTRAGNGLAGVNRYAGGEMTTDGSGGNGGGAAGGGNFAEASATAAGAPNGAGQTAGGAPQNGQPGEKGAAGGAAGSQMAASGANQGQGVAGGTQATGSTERTGGSTFAGANSPTGASSSQTSQTAASGGSAGSSEGAAGGSSSGSAGGQASSGNSAAAGGSSGGAVSYNPGQTASAATSRGANWANEAASRRASAISRPIRVVVKPEQIDVMPTNQGGSGPVGDPTAITFHQPTEKVLDQLASTVKERMNDWGLAGHNMYWRPTLVLQVSPGAEQHAIRLSDLLRDSGIDVKFQEVASRTEEGAGNGTTR